MKHPTPEEWMSFLYDELNAGERSTLADHLRACPDCAATVRDWQAARAGLHWPIRKRPVAANANHAPVAWARGLFKWAAAAVLLVGVSFGVGRLTAPAADVGELRAALEPAIQGQLQSVRAEMRQEFAQLLRRELDQSASATLTASSDQTREWLAACVEKLETLRAEENQNVYAALGRLQSQRDADYLLLKKDVDTVAVNTDAGLRHTEQQLIQLAGYTQPNNSKNP